METEHKLMIISLSFTPLNFYLAQFNEPYVFVSTAVGLAFLVPAMIILKRKGEI